ncbi:40S ribosomal protein S20 [Turnera subulata]|uniref:Small ribosomal subunit protein bS20c n=1 Tax=Turnera subulata TaxID=218843 RepID=A0A9Q0FFC1_9ROSI|nr:40S ribosomal protein S20 [Turnera subulata]
MASAVLSCCYSLPTRLNNLSLNSAPPPPSSSSSSSSSPTFNSLSFSSHKHSNFNPGSLSLRVARRPNRPSIVCEAAPMKKADSAAQRHRLSEKKRMYNKARKSEVRTRMKKVLEALEKLRKKRDAQAEEVLPIEKLIAEAYSAIDKAVTRGVLHRNTGRRRKSKLARTKKRVEIHHGWYTPEAAVTAS